MVETTSLADLTLWSKQLGLLPVPLFPEQQTDKSFVLLNGTQGNFCLDLERREVGEETRNFAWSSNVGHYVTVAGKAVEVQRWDQRRTAIERYSIQSIQSNLEAFHSYLEKDSPRREFSIISHGIGVFRSLRAVMEQGSSGTDSLRAFLYLLACGSEGVGRGQINLTDWGLRDDTVDIARRINGPDWNALTDELLRGRPLEGLKPDLQLVIRHASGQLFQEAHYEAHSRSSTQLRLGGILPPPVSVSSRTKSVGLHFTPSALARCLVEQSLLALGSHSDEIAIFDPACGSGEFLREALRQLRIGGYSGRIKLIGWDISDAACDMARFVLAREAKGALPEVAIELETLDSIGPERTWPTNIALVLMNPPFLAWEDMDRQQRDIVSSIPELSRNRPDLSYVFVQRAASCLRRNGVLGTILPSSFLDGISSAKLRQSLSDQLSPKLIARLGGFMLFSGTTVDAAFYVAKRDGGATDSPIAFWADHRISSNSAGLRALRKLRYFPPQNVLPISEEGFSIYASPELGGSQVSWAPRPYGPWVLIQKLKKSVKTGALFEVKQGVRTGYNRAFLVGRSDLFALPNKEQRFFRPAVVNESILDSRLRDSVFIFFPYGECKIDTEAQLRKAIPHYYESHLFPAKGILLKRARSSQDRWWELMWHREWQVSPFPKLVSTAYGNIGSFAWDQQGNYVIVQGLGWIPKQAANKRMSKQIGLAYLAILNSHLFSQLLAGVSRQVAGGQFDLSRQYVSNIPLPDLFDKQGNQDLIPRLAELGAQIHAGKPFDEPKLEEWASLAYGINEAL